MFIAFRAFNLMSASKLPNDETLNGIATRAVLIRPANQFANAHELRWATHFSLAHIPYFIYFLFIFYFSSAFPIYFFFLARNCIFNILGKDRWLSWVMNALANNYFYMTAGCDRRLSLCRSSAEFSSTNCFFFSFCSASSCPVASGNGNCT